MMANVLVVDDDADVAALVQAVLMSEGHAVTVAGDGARALAEAAGVSPPRRVAAPWMLRLGGALAEVGAAVLRSEPALTRATAQNASATYRYDGSKAARDLGLTYRSFEETAARVASALG